MLACLSAGGSCCWLFCLLLAQFLPGFGEGLQGASVGESKTVAVEFPANFPETAVAGKKASYTASIKGLREKKRLEDVRDDMYGAVRRFVRKVTGRNPVLIPLIVD